MLEAGASGNLGLVTNLTEAEVALGGSQGYVVDDELTGETGFVFVICALCLYIVDGHADRASAHSWCQQFQVQWYTMAATCKDPAKLLCPSTFEGSQGKGTFQVYGNPEARIAVSKDVPKWQMCQCLDDLECSNSGTANPTSAAAGWATVGRGLANAGLLALSASIALLGMLL